MRLTLPFKAEIRGTASSLYDAETIERRLAALEGRDDEAARVEIEFLNGLLAKLRTEG